MKKRRSTGLLIGWTMLSVLVAIIAIGCSQSSVAMIDHPRPDLRIDDDLLALAQCERRSDRASGNVGLDCAESSPLFDLGCSSLRTNDLWAGIEGEATVVARCMASLGSVRDAGAWLVYEGCLDPLYYADVVYREGQFELIRSRTDLRDLIAPISSPEEALSYALLVGDLEVWADYELDYQPTYTYLVDAIEDPHVTQAEGIYTVHLFTTQQCGCGPFPTREAIFEVRPDGAFKYTAGPVLYRDDQVDVCAD